MKTKFDKSKAYPIAYNPHTAQLRKELAEIESRAEEIKSELNKLK